MRENTPDGGHRVLWGFLPCYDDRFAVSADPPDSVYQQSEEDFTPERVFCFEYLRTVGRDNVIRFGKHRLQVLPTNGRLNYSRARVHERMDGSLAVYYWAERLATRLVPSEVSVLRARVTSRVIPGVTDFGEPTIPATIRKSVPPTPRHQGRWQAIAHRTGIQKSRPSGQ